MVPVALWLCPYLYRKVFALCRQPPTCNLRPVEQIDVEILVILPQEIARDLDSGAKI